MISSKTFNFTPSLASLALTLLILVNVTIPSSVSAFALTPSTSFSLASTSINVESSTRLHVASSSNAKQRRLPSIAKQSQSQSQSQSVSASTDLTPLEKFSANYQKLTKEHYLPMAFIQAGILASSADIATQTLEGASPINFAHVAAMATVASTMSGYLNAVWLKQLEAKFPGTQGKAVAYKTIIHATILASIINSAYLAGVPFFTDYLYEAGTGLSTAASALTHPSIFLQSWNMDEFITLTKLEVCMFIPYNTLAFKFVPPSVRPLTHAAVSATFNVAVSAVTLGYFDAWVANAMHLFTGAN